MRVKFLEDVRYCENGFDVVQGKKGTVRNIGDSTACALVRARKADIAKIGEVDVCNHD